MGAPKSLEPCKLSTNGQCIVLVASTGTAIAVYTSLKQVLLFANDRVRPIRTPSFEAIVELVLIGGKADIGEDAASDNCANNI